MPQSIFFTGIAVFYAFILHKIPFFSLCFLIIIHTYRILCKKNSPFSYFSLEITSIMYYSEVIVAAGHTGGGFAA